MAALVAVGAFILSTMAAQAAMPFNQATITKVENVVNYGEVKSGASSKRRAAVSDVVRANNFLLTEAQSRAELEYPDGSVVRIGQNTVFSFDASTRTLSLDKGSLIFYIPKGAGGGTIKTPSLTAAITGTVGKVAENMIAILEGVVTLQPSGREVKEGYFARRNPNGTITIAPFDPATAGDGRLMNFQGPMPGSNELVARRLRFALPKVTQSDTLERTQNLPGAIELFNPSLPPPPADRNRNRVIVPPPVNEPPANTPPGGRPVLY
ncbi:MAG: FecR family protein [Verrucomicrobiota bacterium]